MGPCGREKREDLKDSERRVTGGSDTSFPDQTSLFTPKKLPVLRNTLISQISGPFFTNWEVTLTSVIVITVIMLQ